MSEYITIVACAEQLEIALRSDRAITHYLFRERFISEELYDKVLNPRSMLTDIQKAGQMVREIRHKVKANGEWYHNLLRHFHKNDEKYADIIKILDKEYSSSQSSSSHSTSKQHSPG